LNKSLPCNVSHTLTKAGGTTIFAPHEKDEEITDPAFILIGQLKAKPGESVTTREALTLTNCTTASKEERNDGDCSIVKD
jgi:hypothetical protein